MSFNSELDTTDFNFLVSRPDGFHRKGGIPEYLAEAAKKAGKRFNETTRKFETVDDPE